MASAYAERQEELEQLRTIIHSSEPLDPRRARVDDNTAAFRLLTKVIDRQGAGIHHASHIHVQDRMCRFPEVAIAVKLGGEIVGARSKSSIGKDVVDATM